MEGNLFLKDVFIFERFALVNDTNFVLPIKVEIPTLQISLKGLITNDDYKISQLQELELLDECHQVAFDHL